MIVVYLVIGLVFVLILWIVFIPVYLRIDTDLALYEISQTGTLRLRFHPWQSPAFRLRLFGFRINMGPKQKTAPEAKAGERKKKRTAFRRSPSSWFQLQRGILRSLRVTRFACAVDLDDVVMNAQLVPVVLLLNRAGVTVSTNFVSRNFLCLEMEARLHKVLWAAGRFFIKR